MLTSNWALAGIALVAYPTRVLGQFTIPIFYPLKDGFGKAATNVSWGTPMQPAVRTTFDTGSSSFWVDGVNSFIVATSQENGAQCSYRIVNYHFKVYNYSESKTHTAVVPNKFGTGAGYGEAKIVGFPTSTNDTMTWMGQSHVNLPNQEVGLATNTSTQFQAGTCAENSPDASTDVSILGVGPNSTWRSNLLAAGTVKTLDWSMWFDKSTSPAPVDTFIGSARLGDCPPSTAYQGKLVDVALDKTGVNKIFYTVATPTLHVRGKQIQRISGGSKTLILDSGTTTDMVPFSQKEIIAASDGKLVFYTAKGGFIFFAYNGTCADIDPDLTLDYTFPGASKGSQAVVRVPFKNYAIGPVGTSAKEAKLCNLNNFTPDNVGSSVLGVPFFTAATLHFQDSKSLVGIAQGGVSHS